MTRFSQIFFVMAAVSLSMPMAFAGGKIGEKAGVNGGSIGSEKTVKERRAEAEKLELNERIREFGRLSGASEELQRRIQSRVEEIRIVEEGAINEIKTNEAKESMYRLLVEVGANWKTIRENLAKDGQENEARQSEIRVLLRLVSISNVGESKYIRTVMQDYLSWSSPEARTRMSNALLETYRRLAGEKAEKNILRDFDSVFEEVVSGLGISAEDLRKCRKGLFG